MTNPERQRRVEDLFEHLADQPHSDQRRMLAEACGDDAALADEVAALLEADSRHLPILAQDAGALAHEFLTAANRPSVSGRFGRYAIEGFLGEGGMSWVYLARREDLGDLVAVKFLHGLWGSPRDLRRFAREQVLLAGLSHRSIAHLYDAGVSDGRPWFAMEYVKGASIVTHCESKELGLRERLRLFRHACEVVSYAHGKLIVHLDLKPSNVWVTDEGEVKLLDFGIAQHLTQDGRAVDSTVVTRRLLSLNYAAPEQIGGESLDVQADVYALGVLLYQLTTGVVPANLNTMSAAQLAAALQQDPVRPSVRARSTASVDASASEWRELDAMCLKALSRDKASRYTSVDRLMSDVERFLRHEPLEASIDRFHYYRMRKFLWRHRRAAAVVAALAVTISALVVFFNVRLIAARDDALSSESRLRRIQRLMLNLLEGDDAAAGPAEGLRVAELLDRGAREAETLRGDPELQAELNYTLGGLYHKLGHLDRAEPLLSSALATQQKLNSPAHPKTIPPRLALAALRVDQSQIEGALQLVNDAREVAARLYPDDSIEVAGVNAVLGKVLVANGNYGAGLGKLRAAVQVLSRAPASVELSEAMGDLANGLYYKGDVNESETINRAALKLDEQLFGERHPNVAVDLLNLGNIELDHANYANAEVLHRRALAISGDWYGPQHPKVAGNVLMVGRSLAYQGRLPDAALLYERALASYEAAYGRNSVRSASVLSLMGDLARDRQQFDDARRLFERAAGVFQQTVGEDHEFYLHQLSNLGSVALARGRYAEAAATLRPALAGLTAAVPEQRYTGIAAVRMGAALAGQQQFAAAERDAERGFAILGKVMSAGSAEVQHARTVLITVYSGLNKTDEKRRIEDEFRRYGGSR